MIPTSRGRRWTGVAGILVTVTAVSGLAHAELRPERLRCEYTDNPLGVDVSRPRLSWVLKSDGRGQIQTAYQVLVASTEETLAADHGDLWDTGKVASNDTLNVVYAGKPLQSGQRAFWKVRAWDKDDKSSPYSATTWWEAALLDTKDWTGLWISRGDPAPEKLEDFYRDDPAPLFRKAFQVDRPIRSARAYVTGLGYYEMRLNGKKVGDRVLDPGWTTYSKRVLYSVYDVTDQLRQGPNAIGIIVGNGWYNPLPMKMWATYNLRDFLTIGRPRALLQLNIDYADGTRQAVVTDTSWKVGDSPIVRNNVYLGEVYDARKEPAEWDKPEYDDRRWPSAVAATEPVGRLHAQSQPPIRVTAILKPARLTEPKPGLFIFDLGQNFAGWVRLKARGEAGTRITMRYGELLYPDGTLNFMTSVAGQIKTIRPPVTRPEGSTTAPTVSMGGPGAPDIAWQSDTYILKGRGEEIYTPRFTFHGFRYVEVTGYPGKPELDAIEGLRLNSAVEQVGSFSCSNEMLNHVLQAMAWTQLSNMFSIQSDCPHREKFGYGGDVIACSEAAMFNFNMATFYAKTIRDQVDAVRPDGGMTETAPFVGIDADSAGYGNGVGPIGWGSVLPVLQWQLFQYYGDRRLMHKHYPVTKRWIEFLEERAQNHIQTQCLGDHESLEPKSIPLTSTAFYYANVLSFAKIARELGQTHDASRSEILAEAIRNAFNARFLKPAGTGVYDSGTQACQSFALYWGLVPPEATGKALHVLADNITVKNKGHLATGIFGTKYMLNSLTDLGRADLAYTMVSQKTFPGWGHMLENGATTLWEHWEFSDNVFSHNHPMFGSVGEWFYKALAGINPDPAAVGFDRIVIRPQVVGDLTWAKGTYNSVRGPVACQWRIDRDTLLIEVTIPTNTKATVHLPTLRLEAVTEGGRPVREAEGIEILADAADSAVVCRVGSGDYRFAIAGFAKPGR